MPRHLLSIFPALAVFAACGALAGEAPSGQRDLIVESAPLPGQTIPLATPMPRKAPYSSQGHSDVAPGAVLAIALNKTRPIDLPAAARDVVVGNPAVADVLVRSPTQVFITGKTVGDTNVFILGDGGRPLRRVDIHVGPDAEGAHAAIAQLLPDDEIGVASVGDSLFLTGKVRNEDIANSARTIARKFVDNDAKVVSQIALLGAQQVMLRVRVAEMDRNLVKQLGTETKITRAGRQHSLALDGGSITDIGLGGLGVQSAISVLPWNFMINFQALEQQGLAKSLAEPNLVAMSGEPARFLAGGEIPIPTSSANGAVTIVWKQFGVVLVFRPVILNNGQIDLQLETEVSAIDPTIQIPTGNGVVVPGFTARRATTSVQLPSGGSMMIAGLLQDDLSQNLNAVPGLRNIPVLGALMGSTAYQRQQTEMVVTVTANVINPVSHDEMTLPTDGFLASTDLKRYFLMELQDIYVGKSASLSPAALKGPVGYIVE